MGTVVTQQELSDDELKQLLVENGPLVVGIYANINFLKYAGGLFTDCPSNASAMLNLVVVLFGYYGEDYWLIRGSFGNEWGYLGSMKVAMNNSCGLTSRIGFIRFQSPNKKVEVSFDPTRFYSAAPGPTTNGDLYMDCFWWILLVLFCIQ